VLDLSLRLSTDWGVRAEQLTDSPLAQARQTLGLQAAARHRWLRAVVELRGELDVAHWLGAEPSDEATLQTYQARVLHGEQYVAASVGPLELALGRQIVPWGEGLLLGTLRGVEARDARVPGQLEPADQRLGVLASRVALFAGRQRFEVAAVHEGRYDERPPPLGELSPLRTPLTDDPLAAELLTAREQVVWRDEPAGLVTEAQGVLARWVLRGSVADLALYGAWTPDPAGVVVMPQPAELLGADPLEISVRHPRRWLLGTSGAVARGTWVLRWELASEPDRPLTAGDLEQRPATLREERRVSLSGLLGCTYTGLSDTSLTLEVTHLALLDAPADLLLPFDGPSAALRVHRTLLRQRLSLEVAAAVLGATAEHGGLARVTARYELADGLHALLGAITYQPGRSDDPGPLTGLTHHDRILLGLRWDLGVL